jgi:hypothetical protein
VALYFNGATHQAALGSAIVSAYPVTIAAWMKLDDNNDALLHSCGGIFRTSGASFDSWSLYVDNRSGDARKATFASAAASTFRFAVGATTINVGWNHYAAVGVSDLDRTVWLNGVSDGSNGNTNTPGSLDNTIIGVFADGNGGIEGNVGHQIAEFAIWNVALSTAELAALAKGFSPQLIRPSALVSYPPLVRNPVNLKGTAYTVTAATVVPHPRVIMPRRRRLGKLSGGAGQSQAPRSMHQYRQRRV